MCHLVFEMQICIVLFSHCNMSFDILQSNFNNANFRLIKSGFAAQRQ